MRTSKLGWLNGKMFQNSGNSAKNRPGLKSEHTAASVENGLGRLAQAEFDARLGIVKKSMTEDIPFQVTSEDRMEIAAEMSKL
jgi:hypothetical protein